MYRQTLLLVSPCVHAVTVLLPSVAVHIAQLNFAIELHGGAGWGQGGEVCTVCISKNLVPSLDSQQTTHCCIGCGSKVKMLD